MSILNTYVVERERFASLNCNCTALPNCGLPVVWMAMTAHLLSHPDSSCSYCQSMYSHPNQQHGYPKNTASPATFRKYTTFYPTLNSDLLWTLQCPTVMSSKGVETGGISHFIMPSNMSNLGLTSSSAFLICEWPGWHTLLHFMPLKNSSSSLLNM